MKKNETKVFLESILNARYRVSAKIEKLAMLRAKSSCLGSQDMSKDRVQTSPTDKMSALVCEIVDLEKEIETLLAEIHKKEQLVEKLEGIDYLIISKIYVSGCTLKEVASETNYSYQHAKVLHRKALEHFGELLATYNLPNNT